MDDKSILSGLDSKPSLTLEIDWQQYFKDFCEAHGKYPVLHGGLLLFPDGWRYSPDDYQGPEYPPPKDKLKLVELQQAYYKRRLEIVKGEHQQLRQLIHDLDSLQGRRSVALSQRVTYKDDEGKTVVGSQRVNVDILRRRLQWLNDDMEECQKKLKEVEYTNGVV